VDKKVYLIDQMKTTSGGTCCDVMKKVPYLDLGPNGEVSLRGSENVAVLVNGKRAGILGDERKSCAVAIPIPAAMIDRVEIITSPSSEYDPDGMAGIVNIILKEEKKTGYNGELSINAGNTNNFNLGSTLSYRTNKLHSFLKFNTELFQQNNNGHRVINSLDSIDSTKFRSIKDNELYFINLGAKYDISDRTLFTSEAKFIQHNQNPLDTIYNYDNGIQNDIIHINLKGDGFAQIYELGAYTNFLNNSKLALKFSSDKQKKNENIEGIGLTSTNTSEDQLNLSKMILETDYYHDISDNFKYKIGYKGRFNSHDKNYNTNNNIHIFQYNENINAIYGTITSGLTEKLKSKIGLRFEQVLGDIIFNSTETQIEINNNYNHVYPSAHLIYLFNPYSNLKISYSSRVNRPETKMLYPFSQNQLSSLVDTIGNPNLKPEFINLFEITYLLTQEKYKTDFSLYHHNIKNAIQWNDDVDNVTYNNSGLGSLNGLDVMINFSPLNYWDFTFIGNYYKSIITGSEESNLNGMTSGGLIRCISMLKTKKFGEIELNTNYQLPKKITTGTIWPDGKFTLDMAYQISLYDDQLKITCKAINILDSDIYEQNITETTYNGDIYIDSYRKYSSPTFYIAIQYKFGTISN